MPPGQQLEQLNRRYRRWWRLGRCRGCCVTGQLGREDRVIPGDPGQLLQVQAQSVLALAWRGGAADVGAIGCPVIGFPMAPKSRGREVGPWDAGTARSPLEGPWIAGTRMYPATGSDSTASWGIRIDSDGSGDRTTDWAIGAGVAWGGSISGWVAGVAGRDRRGRSIPSGSSSFCFTITFSSVCAARGGCASARVGGRRALGTGARGAGGRSWPWCGRGQSGSLQVRWIRRPVGFAPG